MREVTKLKYELLSFLKNELTPYGYKQANQDFTKKNIVGLQSMHLAFIMYSDSFEIKVSYAIRYDEIEKIYFHVKNEPMNWETATIGAGLGFLLNNSTFVFSVNRETEIASVGEKIMDYLLNTGENFLKKFSNSEELYKILIEDNETVRKYHLLDNIRAEKAIIAAYLYNEDKINQIILNKIDFLLNQKNAYLKDFLDFIKSFKDKYPF